MSEIGGPAAQVVAVGLQLLEAALAREDGIGRARGKGAAGLRHAGLEDGRLALARARDVERPLDLEELAGVVERVQLGRVEVPAAQRAQPEPAGWPFGLRWTQLVSIGIDAYPRVQLTPHTCAIGPRVQDALLDKVLQGLDAFGRGDTPADAVNLSRGY